MREIEKIAIEETGIPSILLMENASIRVTEHCIRVLNGIKTPKVLAACGPGNNGGDGMAIARHLFLKGIDVKIIYAGDINAAKGDAKINLDIIKKLGIEIFSLSASSLEPQIDSYDLIVDALLGTGLTRDAEGCVKQLIEKINRYAKYVISVDIPSGVHSDTGRIMGCAVKANETVTLGYAKKGLYLFPGAENAGRIYIEDICIPPSIIKKININTRVLTEKEAVSLLPVRKRRSNKGDFGNVIIFAGSNEMPGAAALACSAAYMTGCGLVRACVIPNAAKAIHKWQREVVTCNVAEKNGMYCKKSLENLTNEINKASAVVLGPGIGRSGDVTEFVFELLKIVKAPIILDADALFALSENLDALKELNTPCVITPHPGEMSRLTSLSVSEILGDTITAASNFANEYNVVTVLKDAHTIIASPDGDININIIGNNALSKAGTGDVLAGMIAGFIAQFAAKNTAGLINSGELKKKIFYAGILGAYFHGRAGEAACYNKSNYSVTASDIINQIPVVMKN